jgi:hypothetical protein
LYVVCGDFRFCFRVIPSLGSPFNVYFGVRGSLLFNSLYIYRYLILFLNSYSLSAYLYDYVLEVISAFYDSFVVSLGMIVLFKVRARVLLWCVRYIWQIDIIFSSLFPRFFLLTTHTLGVIPHALLMGERQLC